jgi:hypothetical protein
MVRMRVRVRISCLVLSYLPELCTFPCSVRALRNTVMVLAVGQC